jgi:hypothetical protein
MAAVVELGETLGFQVRRRHSDAVGIGHQRAEFENAEKRDNAALGPLIGR